MKIDVKLGYKNAYDFFKTIAKEYDFGEENNRIFQDALHDFAYCIDKTDKFFKLKEGRYLFQEVFEDEDEVV